LAEYRRAGKRVVFTNGVFDGLNSGHLAFLHAAHQLGDVLIVGVNSDCGIAARRGYEARLPEVERLAIVAALEIVDHVILFDEPTPEATIRAIRPDFHVKGGDYQLDEIPEAEAVQQCGGEIVILPLMNGHSTPYISNKVLYR
jgi:D-beta-D-heptose 7-phosphate kinase/D-beta-D-heptose 1-phosphate adenosyltransferase